MDAYFAAYTAFLRGMQADYQIITIDFRFEPCIKILCTAIIIQVLHSFSAVRQPGVEEIIEMSALYVDAAFAFMV